MSKSNRYIDLLLNMKDEWKWIFKYIKRYKFSIILYIILGVVGTVMSLGVTVASKFVIDTVISHRNDKILMYALIFAGLAVFQFVFQSVTAWITASVSTRINNEMRNEIYSHVLTARWEKISSFHSGDLVNRLEGDVSLVSSGVISFFPSVFTKSVQFFGSLAIVLYYDKAMAFIALLSAPFLFLSSKTLVKTIRKYNAKSRELNGTILSYSEESLRNIQVIKAFDLTGEYIRNFRSVLDEYRKVKLDYEKFSIIMSLILSVIGLLVSYGCYGWGIYRLWQGLISVGTMTLFIQISSGLSSSFSGLAALAPSAVSIATSAGRIMEISGFDSELDSDYEKAVSFRKEAGENGIKIIGENLSFRYSDGETNVLDNVDFYAAPGETIALVGASGEGKTTLLKLLLGLVQPTSGKLVLENENGSRIDVSDSTRRFCSYVPQDLSIFSGTVAENLRTVRADASDEELYRVLEAADALDFVNALPNGIDTQINENSGNISQGQAQRIAIARALLRDSEILLMDEATSALDVDTERKVLENIMITDPKRVCVITTHRDSMLKYCDRIYRISADGSMEISD